MLTSSAAETAASCAEYINENAPQRKTNPPREREFTPAGTIAPPPPASMASDGTVCSKRIIEIMQIDM